MDIFDSCIIIELIGKQTKDDAWIPFCIHQVAAEAQTAIASVSVPFLESNAVMLLAFGGGLQRG